jgi:hypothetical protein
MFTEVKLKDGKGTGYGLGVDVLTHNGRLEIEHSGEVTGFVSDNVVLVEEGVAVVVLTNHMASGAGQIASLVADTVAGTKRSTAERSRRWRSIAGCRRARLTGACWRRT